jgi:hypothetical protein
MRVSATVFTLFLGTITEASLSEGARFFCRMINSIRHAFRPGKRIIDLLDLNHGWGDFSMTG